jgi:hypothetical protein
MGRLNTHEEHLATVEWARAYRGSKTMLLGRLSVRALSRAYDSDLQAWR